MPVAIFGREVLDVSVEFPRSAGDLTLSGILVFG
jgi:hypothetical protein